MPLPHSGGVQALRQKSVLLVLPSSHSSWPLHNTPSPQRANRHASQASLAIRLASSHCSLPSVVPLPHTGGVQSLRQKSLLLLLPSSQVSTPTRTKPSP